MQIYKIEHIELAPLTIIADDMNHAAEIFREALLTGFAMPPKANFDVTAWQLLAGPAKEWFERITSEVHSGIVWLADDVDPQSHPTSVIANALHSKGG